MEIPKVEVSSFGIPGIGESDEAKGPYDSGEAFMGPLNPLRLMESLGNILTAPVVAANDTIIKPLMEEAPKIEAPRTADSPKSNFLDGLKMPEVPSLGIPIPGVTNENEKDGDKYGNGEMFLGPLNPLALFSTATAPVRMANDAFIQPLFEEGLPSNVTDEDLLQVPLIAEIPDAVYRKVLAHRSEYYVKSMKLPPNFTGLVAAWLDEGVRAWKKVIGVGKKQFWCPQEIGSDDIDYIAELVKESHSDLLPSTDSLENSRNTAKGGVDALATATLSLRNQVNQYRMMDEKTFLDWNVMFKCRGTQNAPISIAEGFPTLTDDHVSAMAVVLRMQPDIYYTLQDRRTGRGFTFDRVIQCGVDHPHLPIGCVAGDDETYQTFKNFFCAILAELKVMNEFKCHSTVDGWTGHRGRFDLNPNHVNAVATVNDPVYVHSSWIRGSRNLKGIPFPVFSNRYDRRRAEFLVSGALKTFDGELAGTYVSLNNMHAAASKLLQERNVTAVKPVETSMLGAAGCGHDYPLGRGIFLDNNKKFIVWVNNEDHVRVDVKGFTDIAKTFEVYSKIMKSFDAGLGAQGECFMRDYQFGYHTTSPMNLGTGMLAGVFLKIPNIVNFLTTRNIVSSLSEIGHKLGVSCNVRQVADGSKLVELVTLYPMGYSEAELAQTIADAIQQLVKMEKFLGEGNIKGFTDLVAGLPDTFSGPNIDSHEFLPQEFVTIPSYDDDVVLFREDEAPFFSKEHTSLVAKKCTPQIFSSIVRDSRGTAGWYTVSDAIRIGVDIPSTPIGIMLAGEESFEAFAPLLIPIIQSYHKFDCTSTAHLTDTDMWQIVGAEAIDETYIKKCSITSSRNVRGFAMCPSINRKMRRTVESVMKTAFLYMSAQIGGPSNLKGKYHSLSQMTEAQIYKYAAIGVEGLAKPEPGSRLYIGGCARDWPDARGFYHASNPKKDITIFVNEEDHVKIIVKNDKGNVNVKSIIRDWEEVNTSMEEAVHLCGHVFMHSNNLGYLTTCPGNLGTALRFRVIIYLPHLSYEPMKIKEICDKKGMSVEDASEVSGPQHWLVSNQETLGQTELQISQKMVDCLLNLIRLDKDSERRITVDELHYRLEVERSPYPTNGIPRPPPAPMASPKSADPMTPPRSNSPPPPALPAPESNRDDDVAKYVAAHPAPTSGIAKTKRTMAQPNGSIERAVEEASCKSDSPFVGEWIGKKLGTEKAYKRRFCWIDPITFTLHWSKVQSTSQQSKCINLKDVAKVKPTENAKRTSPDEVFFSVTLKNNSSLDFQLPSEMIKDKKKDWLLAINYNIRK